MIRVASTGSFCLLALSLCGCTSFLTARAIESFTAELAEGDLGGLQSATSASFRERALRADGAIESLQYLPLPREEGEVTEVEDVSPDEKLLTVQVGEPPQTVKYRLKREALKPDSRSRQWVVDDVILTRERGEGKPALTKSITEQMDVLLTAQEFMTSWRNGSREETLNLLHPELRTRMESLSAVHLAQITSQMLDGLKDESFRPEAKIQAQHAVVLLPRRGGKLQLDLEPSLDSSHRWAIRDVVQISSRADEPTLSVAHLAGCVGRATDFLNAYQARDLPGLEQTCTANFYSQTLSLANLETVPLPVPQLLASRYLLEEQDQRTDLMFELGDDTYLISMTRAAAEQSVLPEQRTAAPLCQVDEVTVYERGGAQIKPLSVVFNAQAVVEVFADAAATRDLALLAQLSTTDFNHRVWNQMATPQLIRSLPFDGLPSATPQIVATVFQGPVTEITVTQGTRALTYVLHGTSGRPQVDDVLFPSNNRSGSLKTTLESLVPVYNFAWAWSQRDKQALELSSTDGVRRMVWMRTVEVPSVHAPLDQYLASPSPKIEEVDGARVVTFGTPDRGMSVKLVRENERFAVTEIGLVDPALAGGRLELISAMRNWITQRDSQPRKRAVATNSVSTPAATPTGPLAVVTADPAANAAAAQSAAAPAATTQLPATPTATIPAANSGSPLPASAVPLINQPITIPGT